MALFSAAALYESVHLSALSASEAWIHLRTGNWILENRAIPRSGLFSQYSNLPWRDSTWAFDALLGAGYRFFGLRALPILLMLLKTALAVVAFLVARSGGAGFWRAVALSAVAQYVIWGLQPAPYVFSILFFAIELQLLMSSRRSGSVHTLFWLPPLFVAWANLHMHFVAGLLLLVLLVIALLLEQWLRTLGVSWLSRRIHPLPLVSVSLITGLSFLATFASPYTFHLLPDAMKTLYSDIAFQHFSEMNALSFRRPQDYVLMLLVMAAFLALGRLRSLELFELLTLAAGTAVAFRIQRDSWLVALPAIAVVACGFLPEHREDESQREKARSWQWAGVAGLTALVLLIAALRLPDQKTMMGRISEKFPVKACDAIADNKLPQPLFNSYAWGNFLTWYMPQYPVVVDSRVALYGEGILTDYFDVVSGKQKLETDPMVARAGTLLLERNSAMAKALTNLPALKSQYQLVYSDDLAAVFVPQAGKQ